MKVWCPTGRCFSDTRALRENRGRGIWAADDDSTGAALAVDDDDATNGDGCGAVGGATNVGERTPASTLVSDGTGKDVVGVDASASAAA